MNDTEYLSYKRLRQKKVPLWDIADRFSMDAPSLLKAVKEHENATKGTGESE